MITAKAKLSEEQKESFKEVLDKAYDLHDEWDGEAPRYMIVGQLRIPDLGNGLEEPELKVGVLVGEHGQIAESVFQYIMKQMEARND